MRSRGVTYLLATILLVMPASLGRSAAHAQQQQRYPYILVDLGTLGGPNTYFNTLGATVSESGVVVGSSDTAAINPFPQECTGSDCHASPAFSWQRGVMTNLGTLPGGYNSGLFEQNAFGVGVGFSDLGVLDPLTGAPEYRAAVWSRGRVSNLGTLGGNESWSSAINTLGQVAGFAANTVPDPYAQALCFICATQSRAFLWQGGAMHDLGTLGGPDSAAYMLNERGQVAGASYTNATPNAATGIPTQDPFLWTNGQMRDLGTLGGTVGSAVWLDDWGDVVGQSNVAGDGSFHPFLWDGRSLKDLGTLGGDYGTANWINDLRQVVGWAQTPGDATVHAVLWSNGVKQDLGVPAGDDYSFANNINLVGQVVGGAGAFDAVEHGFLWQRGSIYDLNTLVAASALHITEAAYINNSGEIAAEGLLPNGDQHIVLLIPSDKASREGFTPNAPPFGAAAPLVQALSGAASCPSLSTWLTRHHAEPAHSQLLHGAYPTCFGS